MLQEYTIFGVEDKVKNSIDALRSFEPPEGYFVAFSGGKDSVVVKALCDMAGVKYDAHYNVTSVDPPELVQFIKDFYPDVKRDIPQDADGKPITMWNLIPKKSMPPTRLVRYCCKELKETSGKGRICVTGVRWAESVRRKNKHVLVSIWGGTILNNDNDESREVLESCYRHKKTLLNPIINWEDEDVWEFIKTNKIPYCKLYDEGYTRLGCIGCPMGGGKSMLQEFERWPKYKQAYLRAFERMLEERQKKGLKTVWETADEVMEWWLTGKVEKPIDGQMEMDLDVIG